MRRIKLAEGEYYHLYNRGVDKRIVFTNKSEYERFTAYLYILNSTEERIRADSFFSGLVIKKDLFSIPQKNPLVAIGAYCLMPNHFHILATPLTEGGISKFMHRLQTAYTMFFNEKYERSGSLFQGTYKAQHADSDRYLKYLFAYIHINPAKLFDPLWKEKGARDLKKIKRQIEEYPHSSIHEYLSSSFNITSPTHFPGYFEKKSDFDSYISFWLAYKNENGGD